MTPCKGKPQWGGDLFTTNCEEGRHAWRVDFDNPKLPVNCKWCDVPRYKDQHPPNEDCGSCGGDIGPSDDRPWHYEEEDCRAIREPLEQQIG